VQLLILKASIVLISSFNTLIPILLLYIDTEFCSPVFIFFHFTSNIEVLIRHYLLVFTSLFLLFYFLLIYLHITILFISSYYLNIYLVYSSP